MIKKFQKLKTKHQLLVALIVTLGIVSFWRGVSGLMDELLLPENRVLSLTVSLLLGLSILIATGYATKELM